MWHSMKRWRDWAMSELRTLTRTGPQPQALHVSYEKAGLVTVINEPGTDYRAAGAGWQFAAGRLGSILGPLIGGLLFSSGIAYETLFVAMAVPALLAGGAYARVHYLLRSRASIASHPTTKALEKGVLP